MWDRRSGVVKVGDKGAVIVIETNLATLLYGHHMSHSVYEVVIGPVTLHPLTRAGHGGVTNLDTGGRGRDSQKG